MPLHLNSITTDSKKSAVLVWMLQEGINNCDSIFITEDQKHFLFRCNIVDRISGDVIGKIVYTILHGDKTLEILGMDIVFNNDTPLRYSLMNLGKVPRIQTSTTRRKLMMENTLNWKR